MIVAWDEDAWAQYLELQKTDKILLKRINAVILDIKRNGYKGIGKPEPLTGNLSGWWSRRLDAKNRIVYRLNEDRLEIIQCGGHYTDK